MTYNQQRFQMEEKTIDGDGWCTLRASGIDDPLSALDNLKNNLNNRVIISYLRDSIYNNFLASNLGEDSIFTNDPATQAIVKKIKQYDQQYKDSSASTSGAAKQQLMAYLEHKEVQSAYIDSIKIKKYADPNIAAACLALENKKLAIFARFGQEERLVNLTADHVDPNDNNTVSIIYYPIANPLLSHYNQLVNKGPVLQETLQTENRSLSLLLSPARSAASLFATESSAASAVTSSSSATSVQTMNNR